MSDLEILEYLADNDYELCDVEEWADLTASGVGTVRVDWSGDDLQVHRFDRYMATKWSARIGGVPAPVALALITAAEDDLAAARGGPVSPRQMAADSDTAYSHDGHVSCTPEGCVLR